MQISAASRLLIRQATLADARAIVKLDRGAFEPRLALSLFACQEELKKSSNDAQLALVDDIPVGYLLLRYQSDTVNVDSIAVSAEARGQKIGERLLLGGLERASKRGCSSVTLQVETGNEAAEKLYAKYGFEPTKSLPGYYFGKDGTQMTLAELQSPRHQAFLAARDRELLAGLGSFPTSLSTISVA